MSTTLIISALLVSAPPTPQVATVDAAYEEVAAHRNAEAIAQIESEGPVAREHPAQLINLGIAYAREGDADRARALFRRAAHADEAYALETANGEWTDSRVLARRALASLDSGRLTATRTAMR